jgi:hypothetical protein
MTLSSFTKKLNVYDAYEKIDTFYQMYQLGVTLDPIVFVNQLNAYKLYLEWSEKYFNIGSHFNYEQDVPRLEQYILDLPVFASQSTRITWEKNFGLSFNTWNKMHYACSDINSLELGPGQDLERLVLEKSETIADYQQNAPNNWPAVFSTGDVDSLPAVIKQQWVHDVVRREGIVPFLSQYKQQILGRYTEGYNRAQQTISQMVKLGIMISGPPIKKQTLSEKRKIIKNFDVLTELYNEWIAKNPNISSPINSYNLENSIQSEHRFWNFPTDSIESLPVLPPIQQ